jgi:hypothetical protein
MKMRWILVVTNRFIAAILASTTALALSAPVRASDDPPPRLWLDFGMGFGNMNSSSAVVPTGGGGLWLDAQIGGRISRHWLAGIDIGGLGMQVSGRNYDPNNDYQSIYGQTLTNAFVVTQFEPQGDRGWFFGAGVGEVIYGNKSVDNYFGYTKTYSGLGGLARIGYDWPFSRHSHFETVFNYEMGSASLGAPLGENLKISIASLSFHVAYH